MGRAAVIRPAFFHARLYDFDVAKAEDGTERRPGLGVISAAMDPHAFGTFLTWVGGPLSRSGFWAAPDMAPGLILLPTRLTEQAETDAQLAADAMLTGLEQTLGEGRLVLTQDLVLRLLELTRSVAARAAEIGLIDPPSP
ncbi:MAG: hypothetical protein WAP03_13245 [Methylorubrum rhodinum]|uniref:hypothetical protein n=1 Tax=Methylorubrum rhodinum TaxID=29428 RepID=UPI003BB07925